MNKKKTGFSFTYILILMLVAILIVFSLTDLSSNVDKKDASVIYTDIDAGSVSSVYFYDGEARVLLVESKSEIQGDNRKKFPNVADYYFEYDSVTKELVITKINEYNSTEGRTDEQKIAYETPATRASLLDTLFPLLYIGLGILAIVFVFRMFSKSNNSAMSFGKNRARMTSNIKVRFSDIAGADEEKAELEEIVEFLKNPKKFTELGARIPKGVLLVGQPGTGKTLLARAVAGESNVPFLEISGSDFVEMFVGVGASRVRDLFDQAKKCQPCIVFIDEIDAVGRQRGAGLGGGNDEREQTLNQLLVEMDGFEANDGIIVLAATNRSDVLDPALMRPGRFDRQIYVNVPDVKGREGIIKIHAKNKPLAKDIDYQTLARMTTGFTGADIENMLNEAAILAARANRAHIIMQDITEGINKVIMGPQKKSLLVTENDKIITAYHESGHAIVGKLLENCEEVQEVSIIPRGMAAGYTMSRPDNDDNHMGKNKLNDMIAMMMGGRLSEQLFMNDISTGASNDIEKATNLARKMVTEWGMSDKFGFMSFASEGEVFVGRDYQAKKSYSEETAHLIDSEVKKILDTNYARAKEILTKNSDKVKQMAQLLLEKDTIYKDEVDMIMQGKTNDEIKQSMQEKSHKSEEEQQLLKQEKEQFAKITELNQKIVTAGTYLKQGIISKDDYDKVIKEITTEKAALEEEFCKLIKKVNKPDEKMPQDEQQSKTSDETQSKKVVNKKDKQEKTAQTNIKKKATKITQKKQTKSVKEKKDGKKE